MKQTRTVGFGLIVAAVIILVAGGFIAAHNRRAATNAAAMLKTELIVCEYVAAHDHLHWPSSWDDLRPTARRLFGEALGDATIDELSAIVEINWQLDLLSLARTAPDDDRSAFRTITPLSGPAAMQPSMTDQIHIHLHQQVLRAAAKSPS